MENTLGKCHCLLVLALNSSLANRYQQWVKSEYMVKETWTAFPIKYKMSHFMVLVFFFLIRSILFCTDLIYLKDLCWTNCHGFLVCLLVVDRTSTGCAHRILVLHSVLKYEEASILQWESRPRYWLLWRKTPQWVCDWQRLSTGGEVLK